MKCGRVSPLEPGGSPIPDTLVIPIQPLPGTVLNQPHQEGGAGELGERERGQTGDAEEVGTERLPRRTKGNSFVFTVGSLITKK